MNFDTLKSYMVFMRYKRSGSGLLASLIDAHPNVIFSRRSQIFRNYGEVDREAFFDHLWNSTKPYRDKTFYANGYYYPIEGVGKCKEPLIIGHKSSTSAHLPVCSEPERLDGFREYVKLPLKFVHLVRNPYSMVEARWQQKEFRRSNFPVEPIIDHLKEVVKAQDQLYQRIEQDVYYQIHLEMLIKNPKTAMGRLCYFLEIPVLEDHLNRCAELVFDKEDSHTWVKPSWTSTDLNRVDKLIKDYPHFFSLYE